MSIRFRSLFRFRFLIFPGEWNFTGLIGLFLGDNGDFGDFPTQLIGSLCFKKVELFNLFSGINKSFYGEATT